MHRTTEPEFYYPLANKYLCLKNPKLSTSLNETAAECLDKFDYYTIENCLTHYESDYGGKVGFQGGETGSIEFYKNYGNTTDDLHHKR